MHLGDDLVVDGACGGLTCMVSPDTVQRGQRFLPVSAVFVPQDDKPSGHGDRLSVEAASMRQIDQRREEALSRRGMKSSANLSRLVCV
jgi:hypothetical protein